MDRDSRGCGHCICCPNSTHRSPPALAEFEAWWPGGARNPRFYLLQHALRLQRAAAQHARDAKLWVDASAAPAAAQQRPSALRSARALPALAVKLPRAATGVSAEDRILLTGTELRLELSPAAAANSSWSKPPAAAPAAPTSGHVTTPAEAAEAAVVPPQKRQRVA